MEQLEQLIEQPRGRDVAQQMAQLEQRTLGGRLDAETELAGETHRAQHPHRILTIALHRIADQA
jgi:hypothetical protein